MCRFQTRWASSSRQHSDLRRLAHRTYLFWKRPLSRLEILGHTVTRISDIGVAGLHRVLAYLDDLQKADVVIAVAGMEGALPGVIAGITASPVIGVPTSVGYGAAFGGISSLLTMLNSCAGGVTVVNIDNGFGAAYAAALMVRRMYSRADDKSGKH